MSALLDSLLDPERLRQCEANDYLGELTPEDLDMSYHRKKVSGELRVRDDRQAFDLQLQTPDAWRVNGGM